MNQLTNLHNIPALQEIYIHESVKLRPLHISDAERILEILATETSIRDRVTVASRLHTFEDVKNEIKRYQENPGLIRYALLEKNIPIGLVSLWRDVGYFGTPPQSDDYGLGYFLDPKERGKGLVTSAVKGLMDTVAENLHVNNFIAYSEDDNSGSIAVLSRLGFEPTEEKYSEPKYGWIERKYIKPIKKEL